MSLAIAGVKATGGAINGIKFTKGSLRGIKFDTSPAPVDQPGTLTASRTRQRRNHVITVSVSDPNGIRALSSVTFTAASDGTAVDGTVDFSRTDANTFDGDFARRNSRWSSGTVTVVYVETLTGNSFTLRANWT